MRMVRTLAARGLLCVCVVYLSTSAAAQSFQGGLRGAVERHHAIIRAGAGRNGRHPCRLDVDTGNPEHAEKV